MLVAIPLFNGVGASFILFKKKYSNNELNRYLNLAAGVMLAAAFFSLLKPAYDNLCEYFIDYRAMFVFCGGLIVGYLFLNLLNFIIPHLHDVDSNNVKHIYMFVLAIALHKVPEGLAMGIAYANSAETGQALTLGILLQNIPEGLSVALGLLSVKFSKLKAIVISSLTGLMQPIGMLIGLLLGGFGDIFINFCMAMAGSALLFVVINEVLPQCYRTHDDVKNSTSLFCGFLVMCILDMLL